MEEFWSKVKADAKRNSLTADDRMSNRICELFKWLPELIVKHEFLLWFHSFQDARLKISTCENSEGSI
jgi:hypothetical protein